jgi:hypothetical protein
MNNFYYSPIHIINFYYIKPIIYCISGEPNIPNNTFAYYAAAKWYIFIALASSYDFGSYI